MSMIGAIDFTAGPAGLPLEVMQQAQRELLNWRNTGMGVMEMSHRSKEVSTYRSSLPFAEYQQ